ncbi:MAG TPA: metallophosphoesterase [Pseudonocardiaceae bacterium]
MEVTLIGTLVFALVIALATALVHLFLWKRLVRDTTRPGRWRRVGTVAAVVLALTPPAGVALTRMLPVDVARWIAWPAFLWLALMFYLAVILVVLEVPRLLVNLWWRRGERSTRPAPVDSVRPTTVPAAVPSVTEESATEPATPADPEPATDPAEPEPSRPDGQAERRLNRRLFLARSAALVTTVGAVGTVGYGMSNALGGPQITQVTVPLRRLHPDLTGLRIAVVSDIHLGPILGRGHTERVVSRINELEPDLVAIVGDLVDGSVSQLGPAAAPLRDLSSRYGSFFVTGNHEYFSGVEPWLRELERLGVQPLRNERVEIRQGAGVLDLAGVNDVTGAGQDDAPDFERALGGRDTSRPVVLMAHQPVQVAEAVRHGVDLQLSGHTHGGQLAPFNLLVRLQQPVVAGLERIDDTWLYVSRGAGFWGPPVRVGAPPDITVVRLTPEQ